MPKGELLPEHKTELLKAGDKDSENYNEVTYEVMVWWNPLFVEATTDNIKRTVANVKPFFRNTRELRHEQLIRISV